MKLPYQVLQLFRIHVEYLSSMEILMADPASRSVNAESSQRPHRNPAGPARRGKSKRARIKQRRNPAEKDPHQPERSLKRAVQHAIRLPVQALDEGGELRSRRPRRWQGAG